ncbi:MAG: thiamine pyrophosphate-dependent enzyme [Clostridiales bacterium]|nr:thiamine pyrophosphate-dependent enzyme [Clostridiales bacterium]
MDFKLPKDLDMKQQASWCPGCGHGIVCHAITEAVEELGVSDRIITVDDVACGQFGQFAMKYNTIMGAHGRTIATAAGVKHARPDALVIARPGDGSAYSIGIESTLYSAIRNENILAIVINNSVFGMTGGQMSPTSLPGMKTATSPFGRDERKNGSMMDIAKILGQTDMAYLARCAVNSPANIEKTKKAIKKALTKQMNGEGFCLIDILSPCPTNWKMSEVDACEFIKTTQSKYLPLGEFVDKGGNE